MQNRNERFDSPLFEPFFFQPPTRLKHQLADASEIRTLHLITDSHNTVIVV
jgi:hypothetical protein